MNYSGVPLEIPEGGKFELESSGAPDTVRCTPDSPVNYSGAPLEIPEGGEFELEYSGAPDIVRWCTEHCLVYTGLSGAPRPEVPSVAPLLL